MAPAAGNASTRKWSDANAVRSSHDKYGTLFFACGASRSDTGVSRGVEKIKTNQDALLHSKLIVV